MRQSPALLSHILSSLRFFPRRNVTGSRLPRRKVGSVDGRRFPSLNVGSTARPRRNVGCTSTRLAGPAADAWSLVLRKRRWSSLIGHHSWLNAGPSSAGARRGWFFTTVSSFVPTCSNSMRHDTMRVCDGVYKHARLITDCWPVTSLICMRGTKKTVTCQSDSHKWRSQDLEVGAQEAGGRRRSPLASRKLTTYHGYFAAKPCIVKKTFLFQASFRHYHWSLVNYSPPLVDPEVILLHGPL